MAENTDTAPAGKSADDIQKDLTVGKFAGQQIRTLAIVGGSMVLGGLAAFALGKWAGLKSGLAKQDWFKKLIGAGKKELSGPALEKEIETLEKVAQGVIVGTGATAGGIVGGMMSDYEHWRKVKGEQLGVEKINRDIDTVMESRIKFEDTLNEQRKTVQAMRERLESGKKDSAVEKITAEKEQAPAERGA